jgi:hypothetical protein
MQKIKAIGFDKKITYAWIDAVAYWASQSLSEQEISDRFDSLLKDKLADTGKRSSKSKVKSILLRIWVKHEESLQALQRDALSLYPNCSEEEKLFLHWGMSGATYPFFFQVAEHVGRLLTMNRELRSRQVLRRLKETHGERSTLDYACSRVIRTFVEWGVLQNAGKSGVVAFDNKIAINNNSALNGWFVEAFLSGTRTRMVPISSVSRHPAIFPFSINFSHKDINTNQRLKIYRQNVDDDMVMLNER